MNKIMEPQVPGTRALDIPQCLPFHFHPTSNSLSCSKVRDKAPFFVGSPSFPTSRNCKCHNKTLCLIFSRQQRYSVTVLTCCLTFSAFTSCYRRRAELLHFTILLQVELLSYLVVVGVASFNLHFTSSSLSSHKIKIATTTTTQTKHKTSTKEKQNQTTTTIYHYPNSRFFYSNSIIHLHKKKNKLL